MSGGEESGEVLDEEFPCSPETPYGVSKWESEQGVRAEAGGCGKRVVIFHLPMVFGPGHKGNLLQMISWAARGCSPRLPRGP